MSDIIVRLKRPEGYEDVHDEYVLEDAGINPAFEPAVVYLPADSLAVNFVRLAGLDKHKARECEAIVRQVLFALPEGKEKP